VSSTMSPIVTSRVAEMQVKFAAMYHLEHTESIIQFMLHPLPEIAQEAFQVGAATTQADIITTRVHRSA